MAHAEEGRNGENGAIVGFAGDAFVWHAACGTVPTMPKRYTTMRFWHGLASRVPQR